MKIYLTENFEPTDKEHAKIIKIIPDNGDPPYFIEAGEAIEKISSEKK